MYVKRYLDERPLYPWEVRLHQIVWPCASVATSGIIAIFWIVMIYS